MTALIQILRKFSTLAFLLASVLLLVAWHKKGVLPPPQEIDARLHQEPIQRAVQQDKFTLEYRGSRYTVEPVADYQLWGLVVTHNDIEAFDDIYHDENSVDIKDLCVIWGDNLIEDTYREGIRFWSEPWTCYYQADSREVNDAFYRDALSNSHLLSAYESVREQIRSVRIGDQIMIKGQLVNYYPEGREYMRRKTSTIRSDTGNGACEVMLVDSLSVLKSGTPGWYSAYEGSKILIGVVLLIKLILFLFAPYQSYAGPIK